MNFDLFLVLFLAHQCSALTYWLDGSCNGYAGVRPAITEALKMFSRGDHRLGDSKDADIAIAFQRVYSAPTSDAASVATVRNIMGGLSNLMEVTTRSTSDVRIYCDQDARWSLYPDRKDLPAGSTANSQLPADKQRWVDLTNRMTYRGPPGCKDGDTIAEVFPLPLSKSNGESANRATMTLCQPYINPPNGIVTIEGQGNKDFTNIKLTEDGMEELLSVTLVHELTHIPAYDSKCSCSISKRLLSKCTFAYYGVADDVDKNNIGAYGWENIIKKSTADAIKNAENYGDNLAQAFPMILQLTYDLGFFGLLALLLDKSFKLSTVDSEAKSGLLIRIPPPVTPKRWVGSQRRRRVNRYLD